jgi:coenzyme PQQ precursor peptide PqqA
VTGTRRQEQEMPEPTEAWTTPDFVEYETPMEVTAYAARRTD